MDGGRRGQETRLPRGAHNRSMDFHFPSFRGHVKKANFNGGDRQRSSRERRDRKIMQ